MYRIKTENLSQKVVDIISERIIRKDLLPGERLIEIKIARELGISQGTVREAFRILEKKKMVTIQARRGTIVTELNTDYVESLYDILAELYILMMRKVMINITPENVRDLLLVMEKIKACAEMEDGLGYGEAIFESMALLLRISKDNLLEHTVTELWLVKRWVEYEALIFRKNQLMDSYQDLLRIQELILSGRIDDAANKIREHAQYEKRIALKVIKDSSPTGTDR